MPLPQETAPKTFAAFLQKARQLDLSPIAYQLMESRIDPQWTKAKTIKAIAQYLAFLYLTDCHPDLQLAPSQGIDRVWHYHVLDTQKYAEDCQLLFGYMIHHFPYLGLRGEHDRQNHSTAYALTKKLLAEHFDSLFVEHHSLPGDCEPIRLGKDLINTEYPNLSKSQSRPQLSLDIEEVFVNLS